MREYLVAYQRQHAIGAEMPELRPTQVLFVIREAPLEGLARALQPVFVARFVDIEQARKHQERDLLDHGQRVGDPALPELSPEGVNAALEFPVIIVRSSFRRILVCQTLAPAGGAKTLRISRRSSISSAFSKTPSRPSASTTVKGCS